MKPKQVTLYVDQHNNVWTAWTLKELEQKVGRRVSGKMFVGNGEQIGYVLGTHWCTAWVHKEYKNGEELEASEGEEG